MKVVGILGGSMQRLGLLVYVRFRVLGFGGLGYPKIVIWLFGVLC